MICKERFALLLRNSRSSDARELYLESLSLAHGEAVEPSAPAKGNEEKMKDKKSLRKRRNNNGRSELEENLTM